MYVQCTTMKRGRLFHTAPQYCDRIYSRNEQQHEQQQKIKKLEGIVESKIYIWMLFLKVENS